MNRAKNIAQRRLPYRGFMASKPADQFDSNQLPNQVEPDAAAIESAIQTCRRVAEFTAVQVAQSCGVSDVAVGKARKALKQVLPEDILFVDRKFTELGKVLIEQYFQRGEMTGAAWIHWLGQVVGAMPSAIVDAPPDPSRHWDAVAQEKRQESSALARRSESMLAQIQSLMTADELGEDAAFDAEIERARELAYERELALQLAAAQGRAQARADIRKGI